MSIVDLTAWLEERTADIGADQGCRGQGLRHLAARRIRRTVSTDHRAPA
jgi:hypothetical protein